MKYLQFELLKLQPIFKTNFESSGFLNAKTLKTTKLRVVYSKKNDSYLDV